MIHLADLVGCLGLKQIWYWNNSNSGSTEQLVLIVSEVEQLAVTTGPHSITRGGAYCKTFILLLRAEEFVLADIKMTKKKKLSADSVWTHQPFTIRAAGRPSVKTIQIIEGRRFTMKFLTESAAVGPVSRWLPARFGNTNLVERLTSFILPLVCSCDFLQATKWWVILM